MEAFTFKLFRLLTQVVHEFSGMLCCSCPYECGKEIKWNLFSLKFYHEAHGKEILRNLFLAVTFFTRHVVKKLGGFFLVFEYQDILFS